MPQDTPANNLAKLKTLDIYVASKQNEEIMLK